MDRAFRFESSFKLIVRIMQSQRRDLYRTHVRSLLEVRGILVDHRAMLSNRWRYSRKGTSTDPLASAHAELKASSSNATYDRSCLRLSEEKLRGCKECLTAECESHSTWFTFIIL